ncbi:hypothetical protein AK812_SmicGene27505 [Symbiodinium microadriaticum]|uniref:Uncharacterized protein n=1 Tax=Symbiodinium microadriaticum TaxID=2951 RepID=A0A1Q9D6T1_SYMMI|nr:hypothetical protein AK812_SmicGene27505 [Symbiodinium microadriaticum]
MGKKAAPKKAIVFCTTSVKGKKDIEREAEEAKQAAEEAARKAEEAEAASAAASSAAAAAPADTSVSAPEEEAPPS